MKSHSQNGEDLVINQYFDLMKQSTEHLQLLDIGAYDGITFSNCLTLLTKGWSGLLIEADPDNAQQCRKNTTGQVLQVAVTPETDGILKFYTSGEMIGTTDEAHKEKWSSQCNYGEILVPAISVATLFNSFGNNFQFINVDVEGYSAEVGRMCMYMFSACECICIEHDNKIDMLRHVAKSHGFTKELLFNGENIIFAK